MTEGPQNKTAIDTTPIADLEEMILTAKDAYLWMRQWSGSAFVAGETLPPDAMSEDECKAELYSGLCKLGNHMDWLADKLTALRDAATSAPPTIPEGWQLVPVQPTKAMAFAGINAVSRGQKYDNPSDPSFAKDVRFYGETGAVRAAQSYRAMLATAPEASTYD